MRFGMCGRNKGGHSKADACNAQGTRCGGRAGSFDSTITQLESETKSNFSAWQDSALLKEELVLLFDNELNAVLGEVRLHYDIKTGLTYEKE